MIELSVIVCSHNPRPLYFTRALEALRVQTFPQDRWELLVVDNASSAPLASAWDLSWHPNARHIFEPELGLAPARRRGMREAAGNIFVFVDDDNVLDSEYLSTVSQIGRDWAQLGVWGGGSIVPEFERQPPPHLKNYLQYLALRDCKSPRWSNFFSFGDSTPIGAGLCVRVEVATAYRQLCEQGSGIHISGRKGSDLGGGEDYEICLVACDLGLGIGQFPCLRLTHLIPAERLSDDYLIRLVEGSHWSMALLMYRWRGEVPPAPYSPFNVLWLVRSFLIQRGIDRRMYLARWRAANRARKTIAKSNGQPRPSAIGGDGRVVAPKGNAP